MAGNLFSFESVVVPHPSSYSGSPRRILFSSSDCWLCLVVRLRLVVRRSRPAVIPLPAAAFLPTECCTPVSLPAPPLFRFLLLLRPTRLQLNLRATSLLSKSAGVAAALFSFFRSSLFPIAWRETKKI
ncbi:hypothetical protein ACLOJK_005796 [Asimina triloba]